MDLVQQNLFSMRFGLLLGLLAMFFGFILGGIFGGAEASLKEGLNQSALQALDSHYDGDEAKAQPVIQKAWSYYKRAHMHAGAMGSAAVAMILVLAFLGTPCTLRKLVALALGFGSLGYPVYWMFAAMKAPGMGGTGAAKESLSWLAIPTSGMFILGTLMVIVFFIRTAFRSPGNTEPDPTAS
jgi:hypothetical protein